MRPWLLVATFGAMGCASGASARRRTLPAAVEVPSDAVRGGWAEARIQEGVGAVLITLATQGASGLRALRLHGDELGDFFTEAGRQRIERSVPGLTPSPRERRWQVLALHRDQPVTGWCARGVRIAEAGGVEGFLDRVLYVERLLIVGDEAGGRWATWVEGLVLTGGGWRVLPWVPYEDAVEVPRRDHSDLALWDCDLARRSW